MPVIIGGGAALIGGLIKGGRGRKQEKEGRKILRENRSPTYQIPTEITEAATEGLPAQQYANAMKNIQRQQMQAIRGAQDRRSAAGLIGKVQGNTNDAIMDLDVADAQARLQGKRTLAQYKDKAFDINRMQPFERNYDYGMNLLGAGNENIYSGIDQGLAGIGTAAAGLLGGGGGMFGGGGRSRGGRRARTSGTNYYNGWNENSDYGQFEDTGLPQ